MLDVGSPQTAAHAGFEERSNGLRRGIDAGGAAGGAVSASAASHPLRCAIYTRKSSDEGLEQGFNSLHAQREACEAYVASQKHEGWALRDAAYDDGGVSGGTLQRPGLQKLLADVAQGLVDVVVVYKVDRLTRSLADFAKLVELFDQAPGRSPQGGPRGVSFVSVTQSFSTTSSMGRLTLNVLLSFAQFEREVTAERIRDKIALSKRKGMWMGGPVPLGYRVEARRLVIDEAEASQVREIFSTYLQTGSITRTVIALRERSHRTRVRHRSDGTSVGGVTFTSGPLHALLRNRVYVGELVHKGQHHKGEHEPLLEQSLFDAVQAKLDAQGHAPRSRRGEMRSVPGQGASRRTARRTTSRGSSHRMASLLTGLVFDSSGHRMTPTHTNKGGVRYRYYVSVAMTDGRKAEAGRVARVAAPKLEALVLKGVRAQIPEHEQHRATDEQLVARIQRIVVDTHEVSVAFACGPSLAIPWQAPSPPRCEVHRAVAPQPKSLSARDRTPERNGRRLLVAIARARGWMEEITAGTVESLDALAAREERSVRNVAMMLNLAFVSPAIVEAALRDELPASLSATVLAQTLPMDWSEQEKAVSLAAGVSAAA